jgi:hypothetical protein
LLPIKRFAGVKKGIRRDAFQSSKRLVAVIEGYTNKHNVNLEAFSQVVKAEDIPARAHRAGLSGTSLK